MQRLGVLGWPVSHSRSPAMHNAALAELGLADWSYQRLPVPPELFAETVRALPPAGFAGANVTIPHKEAALALADDASDAARAIGAANTLTFGDGIHAANTDAPGLIAALPFDARGRTALVLGAGGSGRAAAWALREAGATSVRVWNRTPERARALAQTLGLDAAQTAEPADLLVNCTSVGLVDQAATFKELPLGADALGEYACVVDLVYRDGDTALLAAARLQGCAVVDGLEVLVRQGALSLEAWTGRAAPLDVMREAAHGHPKRHDSSGQQPPAQAGPR
jgi:shikimate dehydrogenase